MMSPQSAIAARAAVSVSGNGRTSTPAAFARVSASSRASDGFGAGCAYMTRSYVSSSASAANASPPLFPGPANATMRDPRAYRLATSAMRSPAARMSATLPMRCIACPSASRICLGVSTYMLRSISFEHDDCSGERRSVRDRKMNARHAAALGQLCGPAVEPDHRFSTSLVRDADLAPHDRVAECFARSFFGGEEAGEALRAVAFAHNVRDLFFGINLAREPREFVLIELV